MSDVEDHPLGYLLYRVMAVLRPQVTADLSTLGVSLSEFVCLRILSMTPGRSNAELARDTNVSPQAMNQVLRRLQDLGAVSRPATVQSGRALPAQLTPAGIQLLRRAENAVRAAEQRVLVDLTPGQQRELKQLLHTVGSDCESAAGEPKSPPAH